MEYNVWPFGHKEGLSAAAAAEESVFLFLSGHVSESSCLQGLRTRTNQNSEVMGNAAQ